MTKKKKKEIPKKSKGYSNKGRKPSTKSKISKVKKLIKFLKTKKQKHSKPKIKSRK